MEMFELIEVDENGGEAELLGTGTFEQMQAEMADKIELHSEDYEDTSWDYWPNLRIQPAA